MKKGISLLVLIVLALALCLVTSSAPDSTFEDRVNQSNFKSACAEGKPSAVECE